MGSGPKGGRTTNCPKNQPSTSKSTDVAPRSNYTPNRKLPQNEHGLKVPDSDYPHTQLGQRTSKRTGETYRQTREWGGKGDRGYDGNTPKKDTDWTNHNRPQNHPNPHDHPYAPDTGKRL